MLAELDTPVPIPLLGPSALAQRARAALDDAATKRSAMLLIAEDGSRPEAVALALHARTTPEQPFVSVDCAAGDRADVDRRLFGEPGGPLAADLEWAGDGAALLEAGSGVLFLDHICELPASTQRRLARVMRDGELRTPFSADPLAVVFRLVASCPADLDVEVRDGRFHPELARRFGSARLIVPPLRQRPEDFGALLEALARDDAAATPRTFTQPARTVLGALTWPGNIDELARVLGRILESAGPVVRQEDVLAHLPIDGAFGKVDLTVNLRDARRRFEREYIAAVLERHQWRMSDAARALGIERANLYRKTRQLGIARMSRPETL
ncbi:MAG: sigma 54-interacting transcriptional regulator [Acidobacteria bacterium]|nr:sigma 54-interacting transcriptional regulator [Acidobacteriota bacterium]